MVKASHYRIIVQCRETEDGLLYEGTVHELPDVAVYGDSFDEAYELAIDTIEGLYELAEEQGRLFPQPSKRETEFSGKFVVRVPKWLHRSLTVAATENSTSLNQYIVSVLSARESQGMEVIKQSAHPETMEEKLLIFESSATVVSGFEKIMIDIGEHSQSRPLTTVGGDVDLRNWQIFNQTPGMCNEA